MPTYDYQCEKCGYSFELFQRMTDRPRKFCPECQGKVRRLLGTGAGLLFKGSGFYVTDYRSDRYKQAAKAESSTPASKPAEKPAGDKAGKSETTKRTSGSTKPSTLAAAV